MFSGAKPGDKITVRLYDKPVTEKTEAKTNYKTYEVEIKSTSLGCIEADFFYEIKTGRAELDDGTHVAQITNITPKRL